MGTISAGDRQALQASLAHWKKELAAERVELTRLNKSEAAVRRRAQMAKARIERREAQLAKIKQPGRRRAIELALANVGVKENPPGSNGGPGINAWEDRFGMGRGPWCGAFAGSMVELAGADVTPRIVYTPNIFTDAQAHRNGLSAVVWKDHFWGEKVAHSADLVLFDFGSGEIKHVGLLARPWNGIGLLQTIEGNTSFGTAGSQDNGGAVARRQRDVSLVHSIVAVRWP